MFFFFFCFFVFLLYCYFVMFLHLFTVLHVWRKSYLAHAAGWVIVAINVWPFNPFNPVGQNQWPTKHVAPDEMVSNELDNLDLHCFLFVCFFAILFNRMSGLEAQKSILETQGWRGKLCCTGLQYNYNSPTNAALGYSVFLILIIVASM